MTPPLFLTFEGPDGSGKSTQARRLADALRARGFPVTEAREPGGTPLGERVRDLLFGSDAPPATPLVIALLMSASRAQLLADVILPALGRSEIVVVDRFADSTMAYQSYGLGVDAQIVRDITAVATDGIRPDTVVFVDVPVEVGLERVSRRGTANWLDDQTVRFHERVRAGYVRMAEEEPERWVRIDGTESEDEVHTEIVRRLLPRIEGMEPA